MVFVVKLTHMQIALAARSAPACPEIENHHLPTKLRERERFTIDIGGGEIGIWAAGAHLGLYLKFYSYDRNSECILYIAFGRGTVRFITESYSS